MLIHNSRKPKLCNWHLEPPDKRRARGNLAAGAPPSIFAQHYRTVMWYVISSEKLKLKPSAACVNTNVPVI